jgi:hypothetical protein
MEFRGTKCMLAQDRYFGPGVLRWHGRGLLRAPYSMNTGNASGFVLFGLAMWFLPTLAPDLFPPTALDGSSGRAMWIQVMSVVQLCIGLGFLLHLEVWPRFARWLAAEPAEEPVWGQDPVPSNALSVEAVEAAFSQQRALFAAGGLQANGDVTLRGKNAALWRALKVAFLDEERFMYFLERLRLLAHRDRNGAHADRSTPVVLGHDAEHALVHLIQTRGIDFKELERRSRNWLGNVTARAFLREVADEVDEVVGDARRAA